MRILSAFELIISRFMALYKIIIIFSISSSTFFFFILQVLVPSSGVAGTADQFFLILSCSLISHFSAQQSSCLLHTSFYCRFNLPCLLSTGISAPSTLLNVSSSSLLITWPYHLRRFFVIFLGTCDTLVIPLICSFRILSLLVIPHIHLSILISFTSTRASCPFAVAQFSANTTAHLLLFTKVCCCRIDELTYGVQNQQREVLKNCFHNVFLS